MTRITITLPDDERRVLQSLAERELRHPRDQAALLLREALQQHGLPKPSVSEDGEQWKERAEQLRAYMSA